jgi:hypothetical protein
VNSASFAPVLSFRAPEGPSPPAGPSLSPVTWDYPRMPAVSLRSAADSATLTRPFRDPRVPLPGTEGQPGGATLRRIFLPASPTSSYLGGPDLLARRTNLLSPSVTHLPVFKVTQIAAQSQLTYGYHNRTEWFQPTPKLF